MLASTHTLPSACARRLAILTLLACGAAAAARAQSTTPPKAEPSDVVELNPFEVQADPDNSYGALNSASITRFNVKMQDMPVSADIFSDTFMNDVAATNVEDVIMDYSAGAGYADGSSNGASSAANNQPGDRNGNAYIQLRGMHTPVMQRDSFMPVGAFGNPGSTAVGRTDNFDLERVEVISGPQALLYGGGGAGGVINVTSKQARFSPTSGWPHDEKGKVLYRIDQYGSKRGELDFGSGNQWFAYRFAFMHESLSYRRVNVGSDTNGQYGQLAFRLFRNTVPTTIRLSGSLTMSRRNLPRTFSLNASGDPRNNLKLHYLLAAGLTGATDPATGLPYKAGAIDNGRLTWDNVDSYAAGWMQQEPISNDYSSLTADTKWSSWFSTQVAAGYDDYTDRRINPGATFYAPHSSANTTNSWAVGIQPQDSWQPARTKAGRVAGLVTKDFRVVKTQTLFGADYIRTDFAQNSYKWYQADSNWNILVAPGATATTPNLGRTMLGQVIWPVDEGPVLYPFADAAKDRMTINGVNYVRALQNPPNPALVTPDNPLGTPFTNSNLIQTKIVNRGYYAVNYSKWFDGKLNTLAGVRQGDYISDRYNQPDGTRTRWLTETSTLNYNVGVDYSPTRWLHPYINYSDSVQPPYVANRGDPLNDPPSSAHGVGSELGVKFNNADSSLSGSLAYFITQAKGDVYSINGSIASAINPKGLNGGGGSPYVSIDRETRGMELRLTAAPTRNWRLRFSAATNDGEIHTTRTYNQVYNDQFYANAAGQVTYQDKTPVYVNGGAGSAAQATVVPAGTAGATPLTITMMSTPSSLYFANPDPTSGAIDHGSIVAGILQGTKDTANTTAHGPILTGATMLPISALQLNKSLAGIETPGTIVATRVGDKTTGYPEWSANLTSNYTFDTENWLNGFNVGGSLVLGWRNRAYYYYAEPLTADNAVTLRRTLLYTPTTCEVNLFIGYSHKLGRRFTWVTQLNVSNLFNHYTLGLLPDATTGFNKLTAVNATWYQQPRAFLWTNTIKF